MYPSAYLARDCLKLNSDMTDYVALKKSKLSFYVFFLVFFSSFYSIPKLKFLLLLTVSLPETCSNL